MPLGLGQLRLRRYRLLHLLPSKRAPGYAVADGPQLSGLRKPASGPGLLEHETPGDPSGLDADYDGIACDDNPCPCSPAATPPPVDAPPPVEAPPAHENTGPSKDCINARADVVRYARRVKQLRKRLSKTHGPARRRLVRKLRSARIDLEFARDFRTGDC